MERKDYTPTKTSKGGYANQSTAGYAGQSAKQTAKEYAGKDSMGRMPRQYAGQSVSATGEVGQSTRMHAGSSIEENGQLAMPRTRGYAGEAKTGYAEQSAAYGDSNKPAYGAQSIALAAGYTTRNNGSELAIMREYELLRSSVKQLQVQNRQLSTEIEQLRYEKSFSENKYLQKMCFEEEAIAQVHKEKNYQIEMLKIKNEEQMNKLRREQDIRLDDLHRELKSKEYQCRQTQEKYSYCQLKGNELKKQFMSLDSELAKQRETNSVLTEQLTKEEFANKKLSMLSQELERQKLQMEQEIHVLLDIEAEKSRAINSLEVQLHNSQNIEHCLQEKLAILTDNFNSLQDHIAVMKDKIIHSELQCEEVSNQLQRTESLLKQKESLLQQQKDREIRLRNQLQNHQQREVRRQKQVTELIAENQRLYRELNSTRHQLHNICVDKGIDL